jgi:hypothetical protein
MQQRIAVMRAVIASGIGKSQAVVRGVAVLLVAQAEAEAPHDLAAPEVLPACVAVAAAVAGGNAGLSNP